MSGFVPDPGTNFSVGDTGLIASRLNDLAKRLGITIYGISGYRTPAHSVAVGGSANDPHTKGQAADIAVNSQSRPSAAQITNAQLASVGLFRPFDPTDDPSNTEVNHIQLMTGQPSAPDAITSGIGAAGSAVGSAASSVAGAAVSAGSSVVDAGTSAANLASDVGGFLEHPEKVLLTIALVVIGAVMIYDGVGRMLGFETPVKSTVKTGAKAGAVAGVAAV